MPVSGNSKIRGVFMATETTFQTDPDPDGSSYRFVHAAEVAATPDFGEAIERTVQDDKAEAAGIVVGGQGGALAFKSEIKGPGSAAAAIDTIPAIDGEMGLSLKATFGSVHKGTGTKFAAGWASTGTGASSQSTGDVTLGAGIHIGDVIYRKVTPTKFEARPVTSVAANTLIVKPAWSTLPALNDTVYAMANYGAQTSGQDYETAVVKGDTFMHHYQGMIGDVTLEAFSARKLPMLTWNYMLDTVNPDASAVKTSLPASVDTFPNPVAVRGAPLFMDGTETLATDLTFALANERQPQEATSGTQGRAGWRVLSQGKTLTAKLYYAVGQITKYQSSSVFPLFVYSDGGEGNVFSLYIPRCQIIAAPQVEDINGQEGMGITFRALRSIVSGVPSAVLSIG